MSNASAKPLKLREPGDDLLTRDYADVLPRVAATPPPRRDLSALITVVTMTSPMRCDPELEMIELVFDSLRLVGLDGCRKILICDNKDADAVRAEPPNPARASSCRPRAFV